MTRNVVELRVHGVAGASAEAVLDHPIVVRVAGDRHAGFYRPRPGTGTAGVAEGVTVEAYGWGGLTSGVAIRTASLPLLLPFMLGNLAIWLRPATSDRGEALAALCRLLAGTLTAAFMLSMVGVTLDLVGWQCVPYDRCRAGRPYLSWLNSLPVGPRMALLALAPLLALRLISRVGARSARALEGFRRSSEGAEAVGTGDRLDAPGFWDREPVVERLRGIHVAIGAVTLDASVLAAVVPGDNGPVGPLLLLAAVGLLALCAGLLCRPAPPAGVEPGRVRPLSAAAAGLTVLTLGYATTRRSVGPVTGQLPGFEGSTAGLFAAQGALLVALALVASTQQRRAAPAADRFLRGLGTPVFGAAAASAAAAFAATLVYRVADVLDRGAIPDPARPDPPHVPPLEPPVSYWWAALAALATLLIIAAATYSTLLLTRPERRRTAERIVRRDFPDPPPEALPRIRAVIEAVARSQMAERLGPMLFAWFLISCVALSAVALDLIGIGPTQLAAGLSGTNVRAALAAAYLTDVGVYIISLLVIGLVILGILAYRSPETRRTIGVLWDLGTFWPRVVHPFAPPCYAARAVPELVKRVSALARDGGVVISGHSQGSVLAVAAVLRLSPDTLGGVALLSHGSPLRRIYARLCPAYLGEQTLRRTGERIDWRWRNLWRDTDPIGGPVFAARRGGAEPTEDAAAGSVDVRLRDPRDVVVEPADTVPPPLEGHWPYYTQEAYRVAVRELADQLDRGPRRSGDQG